MGRTPCDDCPVKDSPTCMLQERGRCEHAANEKAKLAWCPECPTVWTDRCRLAARGEYSPKRPSGNPMPPAPPPDVASPPPSPGFGRRAVNFVRDTAEALPRMVASLSVLVPDEEADRRLAICRSCPDGGLVPKTETCRFCTCPMRAKVRLVGYRCPKGHWR